jgi:hypothetical protein
MKSKNEILAKANELRLKCLADMVAEYTERCPRNCQHNTRIRLKGVGKMGICQNEVECEKSGCRTFACDEEIPSGCRSYKCANSVESITERFNIIIRNPAQCGSKFPKLAILIWCLQGPEQSPVHAGFLHKLLALIPRRTK